MSLAAVLLCLGLLNVVARATWDEVDDGVLWAGRADGVVAQEVAPGSPAARAGVQAGDVLLAIDGIPIDEPADVVAVFHRSQEATRLEYALARRGRLAPTHIALERPPQGNRTLYFVLAAIGMFTLLVGTSVRLRRPSDPATLHFFWLCLAFFGMFAFSYSGRLDSLDWFFYWADAVATVALPPLFVHLALVFPERAHDFERRRLGRFLLPSLYVVTAVLGLMQLAAVLAADEAGAVAVRGLEILDRVQLLYLLGCLVFGLAIFARAMGRVRSMTARRQLRWIVWGTALGAGPLALAYAVPNALGVDLPSALDFLFVPLSLIPLAFASAIVRYRLMDVEVIVKRSLIYAVLALAILAIYAILLRTVGLLFPGNLLQRDTFIAMLATLVVVLLAPPVKNAIQTAFDRVFYRDRYGYRRALVRFATDLNGDLNIDRLTDRLVSRVRETLGVDRIALLLSDGRSGLFRPVRSSGFSGESPALPRDSAIGRRLAEGKTVALDDPRVARGLPASEIKDWYDVEVHYFVPCVSKSGTIAILAFGRKDHGEPLNSEDEALLQAVTGQAATALENGRLYQALESKAQQLDQLREFNEGIVESLDEGLVVVDEHERVLRWNRAMEQLYGLDRQEVMGRSLEEVFDTSFLLTLRNVRERRAPGQSGDTLYRLPLAGRGRRQDLELLVNATIAPLRRAVDVLPLERDLEPGEVEDGSTRMVGTLLVFENVTDRVRLEEQLQISDKMASVGLLAAGVAHEVNTPLTGISSFTQMLLQGADPADPKTGILEKIEQQTFRAAKIVNGLLNLSRPGGGQNEPVTVDVNVVIGDVLSLLEHQFSAASVKVRRELQPSPMLVSGFEHKLQQVFLNLFLNARDAMSRGGWLSLVTRREAGRIVAEVADTGAGIPAEYLSRIYDPFFTTKSIGKGTGLGLSITYGIVQEHAGTIACQSVPGQGTRFVLTFAEARPLPRATGVGQ